MAQKMSFELVSNGGNCAGCEWIKAEGEITSETPELFRQQGYSGLTVALHSQGGDLAAGLELGRLFRERGIQTSVGLSMPNQFSAMRNFVTEYDGAVCESACAYAFLGGQTRNLPNGAKLGFHQFADISFDPKTETAISELEILFETSRDQYVTGLIVNYLVEMDISLRLYSLAASVSPDKPMRYLTAIESTEFNVDNSSDVLGDWSILQHRNGLFVQAKTSRTERVVRLYCDDNGNHFLSISFPETHFANAEEVKEIFFRYSNNQIGLLIDEHSTVTEIAFVGPLQPSREFVISLRLSEEQAKLISRARKITYDHDFFFPPTAVRGFYYQPFLFEKIVGDSKAVENVFKLCV